MNKCDPSSIKGKFCYLFNNSDLLATRFMLSLGSLIWGIMFLMPGDTFNRPMFAVINKTMPEEVWGILFILQGIAALCSLFNGLNKKVLLIADSILGCFLWSSVTIGMLLSMMYSVGFETAPAAASPAIVMTFASWWLLARYPGNLK